MHFMQKEKQQNMYSKFFDSVEKFNAIAGNEPENEKLIPSYQKLLKEEMQEFLDANETHDKKEFVDGWLDIGVIGSFLYQLITGKKYDPSIVKTSETVDVNFYIDNFKYVYKLLEDDSFNFKKNSDSVFLINMVMRSFIMVGGVINCNVREALERVCENNMSKFHSVSRQYFEDCKFNVIESLQQECELIEQVGRYNGVQYKVKEIGNEVYFVFVAHEDRKNGVKFETPKIVKPTTFEEMFLYDLIY